MNLQVASEWCHSFIQLAFRTDCKVKKEAVLDNIMQGRVYVVCIIQRPQRPPPSSSSSVTCDEVTQFITHIHR